MNNTVPSALVGPWLVGPIAAIAKGVYHRVDDVPQKSFRKNKAVYALVNDGHSKYGLGWDLYRCVRYH